MVPTSTEQLTTLPVFSGPSNRRQAHRWLGAIERGRRLPDRDLPPHALPGDGPPPPRAWKDRDPEAAARLTRCREAVTALAEQHRMPVENLLTPEHVRRLTWTPPADLTPESVEAALVAAGARPWQRQNTVDVLTAALTGA